MKKPIVGVLALQGAVREHVEMLERCGARGTPVKYPSELSLCSALVIPGGESTTIGKLMSDWGFIREIRRRAEDGMPVFGTCAGMIMLAEEVVDGEQPLLGLMRMKVRRNAFGRQVDSFESDLPVKGIDEKAGNFRCVFIRAPWIEEVGPGVEILAEYRGKAVMARQGGLLAAAFHPELTNDTRVHRMFLDMLGDGEEKQAF